MKMTISTVDPLNHPFIDSSGKPNARLWFLMLAVIHDRKDVPDDVKALVEAACEIAKELERRVYADTATDKEADAFATVIKIVEPLALARYD